MGSRRSRGTGLDLISLEFNRKTRRGEPRLSAFFRFLAANGAFTPRPCHPERSPLGDSVSQCSTPLRGSIRACALTQNDTRGRSRTAKQCEAKPSRISGESFAVDLCFSREDAIMFRYAQLQVCLRKHCLSPTA